MVSRVVVARSDVAVLALLVVTNVAQNTVVPERAQLVTGPLVASLAVLIARRAGLGWSDLGLAEVDVRRGLRLGAAAAAVVAAALLLVVAVPYTRHRLVDGVVGAEPLGHVLYEVLIRVPLATAGPEEVLFRGVVLAMAARRLGLSAGTLFAAALFGLWHVLPTIGNASLTGSGGTPGGVASVGGVVLLTFLAGMAFSWLRQRSGSVVAPFLAHWATNGLAIYAIYAVSN